MKRLRQQCSNWDYNHMEFNHYSVLLCEATDMLNIREKGIYVDCTFGGGGHTSRILEKLCGSGEVIGIDRDLDALENGREKFKGVDNLTLVHSNFSEISSILAKKKIDGAVIDLGVSSYQLDNSERGFSYIHDAPLDMRMDRTQSLSAYEVINTYSEEMLADVIFRYGEERFSRKIAKAICEKRAVSPIATTIELAELIKKILPKDNNGHPAKRTFQAIRIEVNDELKIIEPTLRAIVDSLKIGGRLSVISFHSLEDRIVKQTFASLETGCTCPKDFPICVCGKKPTVKIMTKKPILPSEKECEENSRSHSAKLRVIEKIND